MTILSDEELAEIRARDAGARAHAEANPAWIPPRVRVDRSDLLRHADALSQELAARQAMISDLLSPEGQRDGTEAAVRLYRRGRASLRGLLHKIAGYALRYALVPAAVNDSLRAALADIDTPDGAPSPECLRGVEEERARVVRLLGERAAHWRREAEVEYERGHHQDSSNSLNIADALDDMALLVGRGEAAPP